jgi:hypothetical protein
LFVYQNTPSRVNHFPGAVFGNGGTVVPEMLLSVDRGIFLWFPKRI